MAEISVFLGMIVGFLVWVLLPLVPAIWIYQMFPKTAVAATGTLAGLTINASGAFAGYLIVFSILLVPISRFHEVVAGWQRAYWTVSAKIQITDAQGNIIDATQIGLMTVETKPSAFDIVGGHVRILVPEGQELPFLVFKVPNRGATVVDLRDQSQNIERNFFRRTINIKKPVVLE